MFDHTEKRGALTYYVNDNGDTISEGYHELHGSTGKRGAGRYDIKKISEPTRDTWEKTGQIGTGDNVGYDGTHWYLLTNNDTPNSEPYTYIWVDERGDILGRRNGNQHRISKISRTKPETLPDGTELEHSPGATYGLKNGRGSGHTIFIHNGTIKSQLGATISRIQSVAEPVTPPCAPPQSNSGKSRTNRRTSRSARQKKADTCRSSQDKQDQFSGSESSDVDSSSPPSEPGAELEYWKTQYVQGSISITEFETKIESPLLELTPTPSTPPLDDLEVATTEQRITETT